MILAALLTVGMAASAQPQGGPGFGGPGQHGPGFGPGPGGPGAPGQGQSLTSEQKAKIAKEYTDRMNSVLTLTEKQYKKAYNVNKKYADVLPRIKREHPARMKSNDGPHYDTPGRPHPSGNNGVPGSWSKNDGSGDKPALQKKSIDSADEADASTGATVPQEGIGQGGPKGPGRDGFEGTGPDEKTLKKIQKRRANYDKKIAKVLTAEQNETWQAKTARR